MKPSPDPRRFWTSAFRMPCEVCTKATNWRAVERDGAHRGRYGHFFVCSDTCFFRLRLEGKL